MLKYLFLFLLTVPCASVSLGQVKDTSEWLFIYYMPYDNNLSYLGEDVISMINNGINTSNINAVIQSDFDDSLGMTRTVITKEGKSNSHIDEENSSSSKVLNDYLSWVSDNFEFEKCAVIFLDHGGALDQVGMDTYPTTRFLNVSDIRKSLKKFNNREKDTIDLVFYQVCTKSSIEPLYELKDVCKYTLASQMEIGAPNYYYTLLFDALNDSKARNGLDIADLIVNNDGIDMYKFYTCVDNSKFDSLRELFVDYIKEVDKRNNLFFTESPLNVEYYGERYWDLESFLLNINSTRVKEVEMQTKLIGFLNNDFIVILKKNQHFAVKEDYCGVSISALSKEKIRRYKHLKFYRKFKVRRLDLN